MSATERLQPVNQRFPHEDLVFVHENPGPDNAKPAVPVIIPRKRDIPFPSPIPDRRPVPKPVPVEPKPLEQPTTAPQEPVPSHR